MRCGAAKWEADRFETVLRAVANDEIRFVSWMNCENGDIIAPYDGGFDLFLQSSTRRDALRAKHRDGLSKYPTGL